MSFIDMGMQVHTNSLMLSTLGCNNEQPMLCDSCILYTLIKQNVQKWTAFYSILMNVTNFIRRHVRADVLDVLHSSRPQNCEVLVRKRWC